ncbi:MAG: amidohydrolase [Candidatus Neomarinimicrobiota bacterium]|nr:amidohydrolase [Candidatus Neomarinimicrobiota bacterium]|tara:strand:+ start:1190 stop:2476 length:1287 start_codon:yes stop_codon:yes gene_type:complete
MKNLLVSILTCSFIIAQTPGRVNKQIDRIADKIEKKVIKWRRDIHQNPELSNREFKTAAKVAKHLKSLGIDVQTEVAHTGVVGVLKGGKPGKVVALRADMDGLPVKEKVDLPFASKAKGIYQGKEVDVMHACGHDNHVAGLMGAAEILASIRKDLPGTVKFIFQPAEEGAPLGEKGGAPYMVEEGVMDNPKVDAIFGLHAWPGKVGQAEYRSGPTMAAAERMRITVTGVQTHGALPWGGVDPIVISSQIILSLQTIVSREVDITEVPAVVTIGSIHGGVRNNIIPEEVVMEGTIRTFKQEIKDHIHQSIKDKVEMIASASGAKANVEIFSGIAKVTYNEPSLTDQMLPSLQKVYGKDNVLIRPFVTGAEDFPFFTDHAPGLYFFNGVSEDPSKAYPNHSPYFFADERNLKYGMKSMAQLATDYLFLNQ